MNISTKCNCCEAEKVCKYREKYDEARKAVLDAVGAFSPDYIEVSIKCPSMIRRTVNGTFTTGPSFGTTGDSVTLEDYETYMRKLQELGTSTTTAYNAGAAQK